jgi:hypothetical protein
MTTEQEARQLSLYFPGQLVEDLDNSKGPLSRNKLIVLILQQAIKTGIDLAKLVSGES